MNHYLNNKYLTLERLQAYLEQFKLIENNSSATILEVGKGAGVFEILAEKTGCYYVSTDYDINTKPNVASNLTLLPFKDNSFDYVYCCQVLEHLTFDKFNQSVSELYRIARKKIIISLPDNRKFLKFTFHIPKIKLKKVISIPLSGKNISKKTHGQHNWEIGSSHYVNCVTLNEILTSLRKILEVETVTHYRFYERPYQHFFIIKKGEYS